MADCSTNWGQLLAAADNFNKCIFSDVSHRCSAVHLLADHVNFPVVVPEKCTGHWWSGPQNKKEHHQNIWLKKIKKYGDEVRKHYLSSCLKL